MAPSFEFEAQNVEKALTAASTKLKISKEDLKYEIISYGSSGIFGLVGRKKAKVRITLNKNRRAPENHPDVQKQQLKKKVVPQKQPEEETVVEKTILKVLDNTDIDEDVLTEAMALGTRALQTIVNRISQDTEIKVNLENDAIEYQVSGGEASRLIGKRGQTLEAIQYILEKIVNQEFEKRIRVRVDIEDYLKNKETKLIGMAEKLAAKAKKTGRPVSMGQLNAHDRRIVHIALKPDTDARTQSRGQGFYRKLIIFPRHQKNDKQE